jgi:MFS family permease
VSPGETPQDNLAGARGRLRPLLDFLGLRRRLVGLLVMVILVGLGERMAERFLPLYLVALGGGALAVGLLNGLDNLLSALYSFPGGYLADRLGTRRSSGSSWPTSSSASASRSLTPLSFSGA